MSTAVLRRAPPHVRAPAPRKKPLSAPRGSALRQKTRHCPKPLTFSEMDIIIIKHTKSACLAQPVEHAAVNRSVGGSSPSTGAIERNRIAVSFLFLSFSSNPLTLFSPCTTPACRSVGENMLFRRALRSLRGSSPLADAIVAARRTSQHLAQQRGVFACMPALNPTENTFGEDPDAPLRVAKMQDVHSLLVFRFAAKLSPVHSFLLRAINFAEVLFLWRIRLRRDLNGATEPEPRNTPFLSRRKRRIRTFMNAPVRTDRITIRTTRKKNGAYYRKNTRRSALIFRSKPGSCCRFSCRG